MNTANHATASLTTRPSADTRLSPLRELLTTARACACGLHARIAFIVALMLATAIGLSANGNPCNCTVNPTDAPLVEWDLPTVGDTSSGGITSDVHPSHNSRIWFVSRVGDVKLYRFEPGKNINLDNAKWKSFDLDPLSLTTGGLHRIKIHKNDQWVYVRTHTSLQRIDTGKCSTSLLLLVETCKRTTWLDQITDLGPDLIPHVSDLAINDCNVFTTTAIFDGDGNQLPDSSYLQQLTPCHNSSTSSDGTSGTTVVKRWTVGGGAGFCQTAVDSSPCISGVAVDPKCDYLVYFSEPGDNKIGELNVNTNTIRRWSLSSLGADVTEPRQLEFDGDGTIWVVTGSGHLVHLDPKKNKMSKHLMPAGSSADPFGVAPDNGAIGYTNSAAEQSKVAMMFPKGYMQTVYPTSVCLTPAQATLNFTVQDAPTGVGTTPPQMKMLQAHTTDKSDGTFVEAQVGGGDSNNGSIAPLGITPDASKKIGTYFYAVGQNMDSGFNRIGHIVLPMNRRGYGHARDEDDDSCAHDGDDHDGDGIHDGDDDHDHKEYRDSRNDDVNGGQSVDYPFDVDGSALLMTTSATATNLGTMMSIAIYGPSGQLLASPLPTPGVALVSVPTLTAGTYTIRVKNLGLTPTSFATSFLVRSVWPVVPDLP